MMKTDYSIYSDRGSRAVNEDRADCAFCKERACFVLCDGLGGHGMGDVAAEITVSALKQFFSECSSIGEFAANAAEYAQAAVKQAQERDNRLKNMRTTAVVLCMEGRRGIAIHIGDSRLYRFRGGRMLSRTRDHSLPQILFMSGEIEEHEIRFHPDRNRLLRAIGDDAELLRPERTEFDIAPGDAFLLCSDGFWELITEPQMEQLLQQSTGAEQWLSAMAEVVCRNGNPAKMDNNTAICVTVEE